MENLLPMGAQRPSFLLVMLFLALLGGSWFQCQVRQGAALHRSSTHSLRCMHVFIISINEYNLKFAVLSYYILTLPAVQKAGLTLEEQQQQQYPTGSSLPDCSHACGPCMPCKRVMVSYGCTTTESCPVVYRCMCKGKYYHVPSR
ncbi:hypothetical protein SAY86_022580 [Trapa natans]|uniref:Epidermal patterning factor-like protein n=1 Tax=Trapa natans TaxID=22666 RepID=A0AAN7M9B7_TRANT|nr:hypothetical protein SAY86_022580 [Trapa natans]